LSGGLGGTIIPVPRPTAAVRPAVQPAEPARSTRDDRRDELLDAAATLLADGGVTAVSMDAVAAEAGVSRPLVYKHFANREELIAELWRRESAYMDREVAAAVRGIEDFESIVRTSVETIIGVLQRRGRNFAPLIRGQVFAPAVRDEQRERSRRTRAWYRDRVIAEFGIDKADAEVAIAVYFAGLDSMLAEWRGNEGRADLHRVVDVYVDLVMGGLRSLERGADR
jgi:AcrR family transcriptional regulator